MTFYKIHILEFEPLTNYTRLLQTLVDLHLSFEISSFRTWFLTASSAHAVLKGALFLFSAFSQKCCKFASVSEVGSNLISLEQFASVWIKLDQRSIFQTFWKVHCCAKFLFIELETSNFGYLLIFWFSLTMQSFRKIGQHLYQTFYNGPPFEFLVNHKNKKHQRGDHCKMSNINVAQCFWNFA